MQWRRYTLRATSICPAPETMVSMPGLDCAGYAESATTIQLRWPKSGSRAVQFMFPIRFRQSRRIGHGLIRLVLGPTRYYFNSSSAHTATLPHLPEAINA